jgi:hypothetical protein
MRGELPGTRRQARRGTEIDDLMTAQLAGRAPERAFFRRWRSGSTGVLRDGLASANRTGNERGDHELALTQANNPLLRGWLPHEGINEAMILGIDEAMILILHDVS